MISTITARRPVYCPWVKSTTRPTSTCLHWEALISMSAMLTFWLRKDLSASQSRFTMSNNVPRIREESGFWCCWFGVLLSIANWVFRGFAKVCGVVVVLLARNRQFRRSEPREKFRTSTVWNSPTTFWKSSFFLHIHQLSMHDETSPSLGAMSRYRGLCLISTFYISFSCLNVWNDAIICDWRLACETLAWVLIQSKLDDIQSYIFWSTIFHLATVLLYIITACW